MIRRFVGVVAAVGFVAGLLVDSVVACTGSPPTPPPMIWIENHGINAMTGKAESWIGIEVDLFAPPTPTQCACGLKFSAIPAGANILMAKVGVTNTTTHATTYLPEFNPFAANGNTSNSLGDAFGGPTWFGFSGQIQPFVPPPLMEGEVYKLWFLVETDPGALNGLTVQFAAGTAQPDGTILPPSDPSGHGTSLIGGPYSIPVPEPSLVILVVAASGCLGVVLRRRVA